MTDGEPAPSPEEADRERQDLIARKQDIILHRGWLRDAPDNRDRLYVPDKGLLANLPSRVDLRARGTPIYTQVGNICVGNAVAAAVHYNHLNGRLSADMLSAMFVYYNARLYSGDTNGCMIRAAIKAVVKFGIPSYDRWPNTCDQNTSPPADIYSDAHRNLVTGYARVPPTLSHMKACLAEGFPFIFGIQTFTETCVEPVIAMPAPGAKGLGSHAMLAIGYDDALRAFLFQNSWGPEWGYRGTGIIPYDYLISPTRSKGGETFQHHDGQVLGFWTIRSQNGGPSDVPTTTGGVLPA